MQEKILLLESQLSQNTSNNTTTTVKKHIGDTTASHNKMHVTAVGRAKPECSSVSGSRSINEQGHKNKNKTPSSGKERMNTSGEAERKSGGTSKIGVVSGGDHVNVASLTNGRTMRPIVGDIFFGVSSSLSRQVEPTAGLSVGGGSAGVSRGREPTAEKHENDSDSDWEGLDGIFCIFENTVE